MEPKRVGLSGSTLKIIALVTMFIDHIGAVIVQRTMWMPGFDHDFWNSLYWPLRNIGRIAFPIFCFLNIVYQFYNLFYSFIANIVVIKCY